MKKNGKSGGSEKSDMGRETRVLLERMHSDIQRIAEAQSSTGEQIAEIKATMATKSEVNVISMAVMQLSGDLKEVKNDVKNLKNDVGELKSDVKALDNKVKVVDNKVDTLDGRLKTVEKKLDENLSNHEKRITKLEEKVLA